jgi:hypothetical protein
MLLVKYTGLIFEMRFEMFQIVMFLLSVPVTLYVWWGVLGFEDRVWVSDFSGQLFRRLEKLPAGLRILF